MENLNTRIRRALENFTRKLTIQRTLNTKAGPVPMLVSSEGGLRYLFKSMQTIDARLIVLIEELVKPDDLVWDVGANMGLFAFVASKMAGPTGQVLAFEPDTRLIQMLRASKKLQTNAADVAIIPVAVARENAIRTFGISSRVSSYNHLKGYGYPGSVGVKDEYAVSCVSLDWMLNFYPAPGVLKIDVEGAELEVLQGARNLIQKHRPILLIEVGAESSQAISQFLIELGYRIYDGDLEPGQRVALTVAPWSTIGMPH